MPPLTRDDRAYRGALPGHHLPYELLDNSATCVALAGQYTCLGAHQGEDQRDAMTPARPVRGLGVVKGPGPLALINRLSTGLLTIRMVGPAQAAHGAPIRRFP